MAEQSRAETNAKSPSGENKSTKGKNGAGETTSEDAITLLKNDHRKVEQLFESFESASRRSEKKKIVQQVCRELIVHAMIEEEIFYPACRDHLDDDPLDEAQVEHDGAKVLINELLESSPDEPYYDAKVKVLSEMIKHHVNEEEKRAEGIFAKAKAGGVDTEEIAHQLTQRKADLLAEIEKTGLKRPETRSLVKLQEASMRQRPEPEERRGSQAKEQSRSMRYGREQDDDERGRPMPSRGESGRFRSDDENDDDRRAMFSRGGRSRYDDDDHHDIDRQRQPSRSTTRDDVDREDDRRRQFSGDAFADGRRGFRSEPPRPRPQTFQDPRNRYRDDDDGRRFRNRDDRD